MKESSGALILSVKPENASEVHTLFIDDLWLHWTEEQIRIECETARGWILRDRDGILLAALLYRQQPGIWEINLLATRPNARGQGHMSALLRQLLSLRPAQVKIWLEVHVENHAANALYRKFGFIVVGERPMYYPDGKAAILYSYG